MNNEMDIEQRLAQIEVEMDEIDDKIFNLKLSFSDMQLMTQAWDELDNERARLEEELGMWSVSKLETPPDSNPQARPATPIPEAPSGLIDYNGDGGVPVTEEEQERMNAFVDDRCVYCSGCVYCKDYGGAYDQAGEI